jgi:hypothetical protein
MKVKNMADLKGCPYGQNIKDDCKTCDYGKTYHFDAATVNVLNANFRCYNTPVSALLRNHGNPQRKFKSRSGTIAFLSLLKEDMQVNRNEAES